MSELSKVKELLVKMETSLEAITALRADLEETIKMNKLYEEERAGQKEPAKSVCIDGVFHDGYNK